MRPATVTEIHRPLEPVTRDPFIKAGAYAAIDAAAPTPGDSAGTAHPGRSGPYRPAAATRPLAGS